MASTELERRKLILNEHLKNIKISHRQLAKQLQFPYSTVNSVLNKFYERLTVDREPGSGKNSKPLDVLKEKKVIKLYKTNPKISSRDVAKKVKMSQSYVQKVKKRAGLRSFKAQVGPDRNSQQNISVKTRSRRLYDVMLTKFDCVVMDDETYCKADFKQIAGQEFYTSISRQNVPEKFKKKFRSKFAKKYLVWQAICSCGQKSSAFVTSGTMKSDVYIKECLQKRLLPFLRKHDQQPLFWPDLASCHYSNLVGEWYIKNNVAVVPKDMNPPNTPEARPIEQYWSIVKGKLKKNGGKTKTLQEFRRKWNKAAKTVSDELVQDMMSTVRRKVRAFAFDKP